MSATAPLTLTELYRTYRAWVLALVLRYGVPARHAEDVTQEVFLAAGRTLASYNPARPTHAWLKTIAYRTARDFLELGMHGERLAREEDDEHERLMRLEGVTTVDAVATPEQLLLLQQARAILAEVLAAMDPVDREVFVKLEIEEHTQAEIAEALGLPAPTIQSRARKARAEVEAALHRRRAVEEHRLTAQTARAA